MSNVILVKLPNLNYQNFLPNSNFTSFTSISTPLKLPPAAPLIPPGLPKWVRLFCFSCPSVELLSFLVDFSHIPKLIKNQRPPKTSRNLKSWGPDRPNVDFGMTFGVHLGIDFHEILDFVIICENHPNAYIQSIWVGSAHSKPHIFRPKFNQKFILFLMPHSGPHFSTFWRVLMPKCSILGPPCRPAASQNGIQNRSSIIKRLKKSGVGVVRVRSWKTTCFQYHFWSVPGHHFGRFGMDSGAFLSIWA